MRKASCLIVLCCMVLPVRMAPAQTANPSSVANPALRKELLHRVEKDQKIRDEWVKKGVKRVDKSLSARMNAIDSANTARMKEIVRQYGWPGPELVGQDGTDAAFLLVQHADHEFQKEMLPFVKKEYQAGKLQGQFYALLLDRVLVREGKPQIYGTQAKSFDKWKGKEPVLQPIEDEAGVDQRRAAVGLPPLSEYLQSLKQAYFPKDK